MKTKHLRLMQRVYIILFFCFMYLPIAYMIVFSFNQSKCPPCAARPSVIHFIMA